MKTEGRDDKNKVVLENKLKYLLAKYTLGYHKCIKLVRILLFD